MKKYIFSVLLSTTICASGSVFAMDTPENFEPEFKGVPVNPTNGSPIEPGELTEKEALFLKSLKKAQFESEQYKIIETLRTQISTDAQQVKATIAYLEAIRSQPGLEDLVKTQEKALYVDQLEVFQKMRTIAADLLQPGFSRDLISEAESLRNDIDQIINEINNSKNTYNQSL